MRIPFFSKPRFANVFLVSVFLASAPLNVHAATFENLDLTPSAAGVANAVTSGVGDISDALYNPAGLAWQEGVQAIFSNKSRSRNSKVKVGGATTKGIQNLGTRDVFAVSWLPKGSSIGMAASVSVPYDTRLLWGSAFPSLQEFDITLKRYSADVFWRTTNQLAFSGGLDIYDSKVTLNTNAKSFSGSGWSGVGGHVGMRWEFSPFWVLGAHYRQGIEANASNKAGDVLAINLPDQLNIGLSHSLMDDEIVLAFDIKRSAWSALKSLDVTNGNISSQTNAANLRDTTDAMLGLTWYWRNNTQLRFGYAYEQGANQDVNYQPLLSDLNGHKIAMGFGGEVASMHLDVTWTGTLFEARTATGTYSGSYDDSRYNLMFSISNKF